VSRNGYVNLLQPGDRRSLAAGDSREAVAARYRLEERGLAEELQAAIERQVGALAPRKGGAVLDVGAGTGSLLERITGAFGLEGWALDLSAAAVERGARRRPGLSWVVANADRQLPFSDRAFDLLTSSVGPKNPPEFHRVLVPGGALLLVVPAPDDLIELREALLGEGRSVDRAPAALASFEPLFECVSRTVARRMGSLERAGIEDLLAVTYRGGRHRERERLAELDALEITFASEVLHFVPR
jgi:23S rRNA (guanine745-N1)-methyltransferase